MDGSSSKRQEDGQSDTPSGFSLADCAAAITAAKQAISQVVKKN